MSFFAQAFTEAQRAAIASAASDRLQFASRLDWTLRIAGREFDRDRVEECVYKGEDGYACVLEASVLGRLPDAWEQERCEVVWYVEGVECPGFRGYVVDIRRDGPYSAIEAYTGGYEMDRTPVGEGPSDDREWSGTRPDTALYDLLLSIRERYDGYRIGPFPSPLLYRLGEDRVTWDRYVKDVAGEVEEAARLLVRDWPTNVAYAYPQKPVTREEAASWHVEDGRDGTVSSETPDGERYARVIAMAEQADGTRARKATARVDNRGRGVFRRSALPVAVGQDSTEESAYGLVFEEALRLGRNDRSYPVELNYPPFFVARGDVWGATEKEYLAESVRVERGLFRVHAFEVDVVGLKGTVSGEGMPTGVEEEPVLRALFPGPAGVRPLWGLDTDAVPGFDASLPWVRDDGTHVALDRQLAAAYGVRVYEDPENPRTVVVGGV